MQLEAFGPNMRLVAAIVIACAASPSGGWAQSIPTVVGGGGSQPLPRFVSPSGKPYASEPGEPYAKAQWFAQTDTNGDGALTEGEFITEAEGFFAELDVDRDGRISPMENDHYEKVVVPEVSSAFGPPGGIRRPGSTRPSEGKRPSGDAGGPGGMGRPGGTGGGPPPGVGSQRETMSRRVANMPQGAARFAILGFPQPLIAADSSFNGSISPLEMREAASQRFALLNDLGNRDGRITWEELPEAPVEKVLGGNKRARSPKKEPKE